MFEFFASFLWGNATLIAFLLLGIYFTITLKGIQVKLFTGIKIIWKQVFSKEKGTSSLTALLTSLGAAMGPGNIVGVSTALILGGAGAIFWMCVCAFLGMAIRYAESYYAVVYRQKGSFGGTMYVSQSVFKTRFVAVVFCVTGVFVSIFMADMLPARAIADALKESYNLPPLITLCGLSAITAPAIVGGLKRIGTLTSIIIPVLSIAYVLIAVFIIFKNPESFINAITLIFKSAFSLKAGISGLIGGAVRHGLVRGVHTNEAGMGTDPILAASTTEKDPDRQATVSMLSPFIDTIIFCSVTGIILVMAGDFNINENAASLVAAAFQKFLPYNGSDFVNMVLFMLVYSTLISWYFYGSECFRYITGGKYLKYYAIVYSAVPIASVFFELPLIINLCDIGVFLMTFSTQITILRAHKINKKCEKTVKQTMWHKKSTG